VTCDEVFLPFYSKEGYYPDTSTTSIARIRLDSLSEPSFPAKSGRRSGATRTTVGKH